MSPNPPVRRVKTYTGAQGYVYQYYFVGKRPALANDPEAPATEFVFDVTSDRKLTYAVSVFLADAAVKAWAATHGRPLNDAEIATVERSRAAARASRHPRIARRTPRRS